MDLQKKEKVLIAVSDTSLATNIENKLKSQGYTALIVKNGNDTLEKLKTENPALALVDLVLPGKNGYDVLTEKSLDRMITKIPVIVVSNSGTPIEMKRIPSTSSVKDFIIKAHVDPEEVFKKVEIALGHAAPAPAANATVSASASKTAGKTILWVEDDKFLSSILYKKFESSGHTVMKADNGEQALQMINTAIPNIIILDILLPGMDGFEVLQKIKMNEKFRNIPVIILSNTSKPSDLEKAKMLGAQKFLLKAAVSLDQIVKEVSILAK